MRRVMILGCSGAGKSTFAQRLGAAIGAPVVHLDSLFWKPGWVERETPEFVALVTEALAGDTWVSDGNYVSKTFPIRLPRADTIILLLQPRWLCMVRVLTRALKGFGKTRPDIGPGCTEDLDLAFLRWVWEFEKKSLPRIEAILAAPDVAGRVVRLAGDRAMANYLAQASETVAA